MKKISTSGQSQKTKDVKKTFIILVAINSLYYLSSKFTVTIWPSIDNLSPLNYFEKNRSINSDFYSFSTNHSLRLPVVLILHILNLIPHESSYFSLVLLSVFILLVGLPLLIVAVSRTLSLNISSNIVAVTILMLLLNSGHFARFETNDFYLNPFAQGATTSNISTIFFLISCIVNTRISIPLKLLSILCHISTGLILVIILELTRLRIHSTKEDRKIYILKKVLILISLLVIGLVYLSTQNLSSWRYYLIERAPHHFKLSYSSTNLNHTLIFLIAFFWTFTIFHINNKLFKFFKIFITILTFYVAYKVKFNYALPSLLGLIALTLYRKNSNITKIICNLEFALWTLISIQIGVNTILISPFVMILPGTRIIPFVNSILVLAIVINYSDRFLAITQWKQINFKINSRLLYLTYILFIVTSLIIVFGAHLSKYNKFEQDIKMEYKSNISMKNKVFIPLDVDSTGLREFAGMSIYVDDYVFWGDLNEYQKRYKQLKVIRKLYSADKLSLVDINYFKIKEKNDPQVVLIVKNKISLTEAGFYCFSFKKANFCSTSKIGE
jgi:hypothetical protein